MHYLAPGRANLTFHLRVLHGTQRSIINISTLDQLEELHKRCHSDDTSEGMDIPTHPVQAGDTPSRGL